MIGEKVRSLFKKREYLGEKINAESKWRKCRYDGDRKLVAAHRLDALDLAQVIDHLLAILRHPFDRPLLSVVPAEIFIEIDDRSIAQ